MEVWIPAWDFFFFFFFWLLMMIEQCVVLQASDDLAHSVAIERVARTLSHVAGRRLLLAYMYIIFFSNFMQWNQKLSIQLVDSKIACIGFFPSFFDYLGTTYKKIHDYAWPFRKHSNSQENKYFVLKIKTVPLNLNRLILILWPWPFVKVTANSLFKCCTFIPN